MERGRAWSQIISLVLYKSFNPVWEGAYGQYVASAHLELKGKLGRLSKINNK